MIQLDSRHIELAGGQTCNVSISSADISYLVRREVKIPNIVNKIYTFKNSNKMSKIVDSLLK